MAKGKKSKKASEGAKSIGFGKVKRRFEKWAFFGNWALRHTKKALGLHNPMPEGFMVGASVATSQVSLKVVRDDADIVVAMDVGGARHLVSELNKAINMVKYRG